MKRRRLVLRFLYALCAAVLLAAAAKVDCAPEQIVAVSVPESSAGLRLRDAVEVVSESAEAIPYVADAALNELDGILMYALGADPTEGKSPNNAGQNTKNNVAISLLRLHKMLHGARTVRFSLEPYEGAENVNELCVFVRRQRSDDEECIRTGALYDRTRRMISTADGTGMMGIGYNFNYSFDTFSAASDPWQRNFGFCRMYDGAAFLIGDVYKTIRIPFRYDGKDWMIQVWKGIYSWNMLGGEIGIYNKPIDREAAFYDCATDPERIPMAFTVRLGDETIVQTDLSLSWWQTTFTVHKAALPRCLTMEFSLTFPNARMLNAFRESLQTIRPDVTIRQDGLTLCCVWAGK